MTTFPLIPEEEARQVWSGDGISRREYFFSTIARTGAVCAVGGGMVIELEGSDNLFLPLWPHPRFVELEEEVGALVLDGEEPGALDLDELLDERLERHDEYDDEIIIFPAKGLPAVVLSLERFRVVVFEQRLALRTADLPDREERCRALREEFYDDQRRRARVRLDSIIGAPDGLVAHVAGGVAAGCDDKLTSTRQWARARELPWSRLYRALNILSCTCDCEVVALLTGPGNP